MDKLWYIYTMEYYSAVKKNSLESVLMKWMKLEPIIQTEVSQKDKHQRSQDGRGIGQGEHFLPYKFIERTIERRANLTKQLLIAS